MRIKTVREVRTCPAENRMWKVQVKYNRFGFWKDIADKHGFVYYMSLGAANDLCKSIALEGIIYKYTL